MCGDSIYVVFILLNLDWFLFLDRTSIIEVVQVNHSCGQKTVSCSKDLLKTANRMTKFKINNFKIIFISWNNIRDYLDIFIIYKFDWFFFRNYSSFRPRQAGYRTQEDLSTKTQNKLSSVLVGYLESFVFWKPGDDVLFFT